MYVKPSRRQINGVYVPDNYNGTTFTESTPPPSHSETADTEPTAQYSTPPQESSAEKAVETGLLPSLFSGFGGLRSDDLLLLALILLMSRSQDQNGKHTASEILPLLALLLFLG